VSAVRLRLTLFYAALLAAVSGLLLGASYLLVSRHLHRTLDAGVADRATSALASQYVLALLAALLLAAGGGWLVSGEVLAPLTRAIAAQRRFVANASHELRTPMTAIRVAAEVALDDPAPTVEDLRLVLRETVATSEGTERLMAALLSLAASTDGGRADDDVELGDVVRAVLPPSRRIDASLEPTWVRGDAVLLGRAAANLVDNALRHGGPGGRVRVHVHDAELVVRNGGPVIAREDLARLTQPFERLGRRASPGAGLGLSIVEAIARSHGGALVLDAPETGGLVARLRLPARQPAVVRSRSRTTSSTSSESVPPPSARANSRAPTSELRATTASPRVPSMASRRSR
jgi:signal transduction histidine kinase